MYVIWGSTYLAIRWAVETLPPFGVAVALGCAFDAEPFTPRMAAAAGLIIGAVVLITTSRGRSRA